MTLNAQSRRRIREGAAKGRAKQARTRRRKKIVALFAERETAAPERVELIDVEIAELRAKQK